MKIEKKLFVFIFSILLIGIVSATYCCQETVSGAYCQNVENITECKTGVKNQITGETYSNIQTFCQATSYCMLGTCINPEEGSCMPNVAQSVCEQKGGQWSAEQSDKLPQCKLGCCQMGNQGFLETQIGCNKIGEDYGITTKFNSAITDDLLCQLSVDSGEEGACVYTKDYIQSCERATNEECNKIKSNSGYSNVSFHLGYLCSATSLGSICGRTEKTECDSNYDVRFVDGCGNLANIYDSTKVNNENYWTYIQNPDCGDYKGNKNSATCGDCDYYSGSMCLDKGKEKVDYGDYICGDLDCVNYDGFYNGNGDYPRHGESWCASAGTPDTPGSSYFRLYCYNGEVNIEECDSTRQMICGQDFYEDTGYSRGSCQVKNRWEDCWKQNTSESCNDTELRDCQWMKYDGKDYVLSEEFGFVRRSDLEDYKDEEGICVPKYAPGFERDKDDKIIGGESCQMVNTVCQVKYERTPHNPFDNDWHCVDNCYCEKDSFKEEMNKICSSLGDCGIKKNYLDIFGKEQEVIKKE
jgi:hypothetical protein